MNKVAIYCRLSDEDQNKKMSTDESESIQNQKKLLVKYAEDQKWIIYEVYCDEDYSGLDADRPAFNKMLSDAKQGKFNIILCKTQSRFTRDMEVVEKYLHTKFIEWGIRFISVVDGVDTYDYHNKKTRQINGLVNEWYCEDISESIRAVFRLKQEKGYFIGSFAPFGYIKDPENKNKLIIDKEAAEIVKLIFKLYKQGTGTQKIAEYLNKNKVANPTQYKKNSGFNFRNNTVENFENLWTRTAVRRVLRNEVYIGNTVQHKREKLHYKHKKMKELPRDKWIVVKDTHEGIINKENFQMVQEKLDMHTRSLGAGSRHIFAGKVRCKDCGSSMQKVGNGKGYTYLRCKSSFLAREYCTSHCINYELLYNAINERLYKHLTEHNPIIIEDNAEEMIADFLISKQLRKLEEDLTTLRDSFRELYLDKVKGIISIEQFKELSNLLSKKEQCLLEQKEKMLQDSGKSPDKTEEEFPDRKQLEFALGNKQLTYEMVQLFIEKIEVNEKDKDSNEQEITIYWNF